MTENLHRLLHDWNLFFFCTFRDAAVCQQSGRGFPRLVGGPDDISRLRAVCELQQRCTACHPDASGSPDSDGRCLSERHPDSVCAVFAPHSSAHSSPDPISYRRHRCLGATAGDPQPAASSATASNGPGHPASADSPTCHPGTYWIFMWHLHISSVCKMGSTSGFTHLWISINKTT